MAQHITYAGGRFLTADDVAFAVLDYAAGLAARSAVDVVEVPTRRIDGTPGRVRLMVGRSIPLALESAWDDGMFDDDPDDRAAIERLRAQAASLRQGSAMHLDQTADTRVFDRFGDL